MTKKKNTAVFSFYQKLVLFANILVVLATLLAYIAPVIDPKSAWFFSFFGLFYPILFIINLLFIIYWSFKDIKYGGISLVTLLLGWSFMVRMIVFNTTKGNSPSHALSVISYNISNALGAYDRQKDVKASKKEKMFEYLKRFDDEDILCLQEVGSYATDILKQSFPNHYMHKIEKGAVILSKHKIINKGQIDFGTKTNSCLWADIIVDLDTIRVYSLHLQSNRISKDADDVMAHGKIDDKKTWRGIKGILQKFRQTHITRTSQAKQVKVHIDDSPYPVLVCGDFNDTPISYTYTHLSEGLKDAFVEKGNGLGTTFNGNIPLLRIDYVLCDPKFEIHKFNVIQENYSDHYAVACLLNIKK